MLILPENAAELVKALEEYGDEYVFGNLSNTLITDKGIRGNVIITSSVKGMEAENERITVSCGENLSSFAAFAMQNELTGAEFCYGIPGTLGGAVYMNAGAYGGQISDIFESGVFWSKEKGLFTVNKEEMNFSYRKSVLQSQKIIAVKCVFRLKKGEKAQIKAKMDELMTARKTKQPLEYPSCGSVFKRPEGNFAGALIEQCSLKGVSIGGAAVSTKHAGFIINTGNAKSQDFLDLVEYIRKTVFEKLGVMLEEEVVTVGER